MKVERKLFLVMGIFILLITPLCTYATQMVLKDSLNFMTKATHQREINRLSQLFVNYYESNNASWTGVDQIDITKELGYTDGEGFFVILSTEQDPIFIADGADQAEVVKKGAQHAIKSNNKAVAWLYFYDRGVTAQLQTNILDSANMLLLSGTILFVLIALLIAYWLSKRVTEPLHSLLNTVDDLEQGKRNRQLLNTEKGEYGRITQTVYNLSRRLQRAERIRDNLTADLSNELHTPLILIGDQLQTMHQQKQAPHPVMLQTMQSELNRLAQLVNDLHQLSLAASNQLSLEMKTIDLATLWPPIIQQHQALTKQRQQEIRWVNTAEISTVHADSHRLTQAFLHLLHHAIHYTAPGEKVRIILDQEASNDWLQVIITGSGLEVETERLQLLLNYLERKEATHTQEATAEGLGLAVAKQLILAHHGSIKVDHEITQGITWIVRLPITRETPQ